MTPENAIHVIRECLMAAFWLSMPLLTIGFCVGVVMNLIQVTTSLQDSAFSTFLLMPWMLNKLTSYTVAVFTDIAKYGH